MARLFTGDFEEAFATEGWTTSGTPTRVTDPVPPNGDGSYACVCDSLNEGVYWSHSANISESAFYTRLLFRVAAWPTTGNTRLMWIANYTGPELYRITVQPTGTLLARTSAGVAIGSPTDALSLDTWYVLETRTVRRASGNEDIEARVYLHGSAPGASFVNASSDRGWGAGPGRLGLGTFDVTATIAFDSAAVNDTTTGSDNSWVGPVYVEPTVTSTPVGEVSLAAPAQTPSGQVDHVVHIRARKTGTGTVDLYCALTEGAVNRSGELGPQTLTASLAEYTFAMSDAASLAITDYSNLGLRFWGVSSDGDTGNVEIADVWLAVPAGSANVVSRSAAIQATGGVGAVPQRVLQRSAAVATSAQVGAAPQRIVQRSVAVQAGGQVGSSGTRIGVYSRSSEFTARPSLTSAPQRVLARALAFGASGAIASSGQKVTTVYAVRVTWLELELPGGSAAVSRSVAFQANAQVAAASFQRVHQRGVAVAATGVIGSQQGYKVTSRGAAITAVASVGSTPSRALQRSAAVAATGAITVVSRYRIVSRAVAIDQWVAIDSVPETAGLVTGTAAFTARPALSVGSQRALSRATAFAATGAVIVVSRLLIRVRSSDVTARPSIAVTGYYRIVPRNVAISSRGVLTVAAFQVGVQITRSVAIQATGQVAVTPQRALSRSAAVLGRASISAVGEQEGLVTRTADFTGRATITVSASRVLLRSASVTGRGQITAIGLHIVPRNVALLARGSITVGTVQVGVQVTRSVAITGRGILAATPQRVIIRSAAFAATAQVGSAPQRVLARSTGVLGRGVLTVGGLLIRVRAASVLARGSITVGQPYRVVSRNVAIAATGAIQVTPRRILARSVAITARPSIAAMGEMKGQVLRSVDVTARPALSVTGVSIHFGRAALVATGTLQTSGYRVASRGVAISARASIAVSAQVGVQVVRSTSFVARGSITVTGLRALPRSTALSARGVITVGTAYRIVSRSAGVSARGVLSASGLVIRSRAVALVASAQVTVVPERIVARATAFTATVSITSRGHALAERSTAISATASLTVLPQRIVTRRSGFVARASITSASDVRGQVIRSAEFTTSAQVSAGIAYSLVARGVAVASTGVLEVGSYKIAQRGVGLVGHFQFSVTAGRIQVRSVGVVAKVRLGASGFPMVPRPSIYTGDSTGLTVQLIGPQTRAEIIGSGTEVQILAPRTKFSNVN